MGDDEPDYGGPECREPEYDLPEGDWDEEEPESGFVYWPRGMSLFRRALVPLLSLP